jgi:hypothetical protein
LRIYTDWWKKKHGLSLTDASVAAKTNLSADGYSNLEMYLDELAGDPVVYSTTSAIGPVAPARAAPRLLGGMLRLDLACASEVRVDAVDLSGRIIASVYHGALPAGEASLPTELSGRRGVNFLRIEIGGRLVYCTLQMRLGHVQ